MSIKAQPSDTQLGAVVVSIQAGNVLNVCTLDSEKQQLGFAWQYLRAVATANEHRMPMLPDLIKQLEEQTKGIMA